MGRSETIGKLEEQLQKIAAENEAVSMSVAVARGGETAWKYALGYADKETGALATPDTVYRVASVSKPLACMAVLTLVDEGRAELDRDISDYLGYAVRNPYYPESPITLRQLMTHTSTLTERGSYSRVLVGDMPPYKLSEILAEGCPGYSRDNYLNARPGERFEYSSFGTGIMGAVAERITGKRFAAFAHERIFGPLGLDAGFDPESLSGRSRIAKPYEVGGMSTGQNPEWLKKSLELKKLLSGLPVGEAYRTAQGNAYLRPSDMAAIMGVFFGGGSVRGVRILSKQSVDEMLKLQFADKNVATGLNLWHMDYLMPGTHLLGHYGRAFGALSAMAFDPSAQIGAAVFTNGVRDISEGRFAHNVACTQAMRLLIAAADEL